MIKHLPLAIINKLYLIRLLAKEYPQVSLNKFSTLLSFYFSALKKTLTSSAGLSK